MTVSPDVLWTFIYEQSLRASALIAGVLILRTLFGRRLPAQCFHLLWLLVAVRLICPAAPQSAWSVFNLFSKAAPVQSASEIQWRVRTESLAPAPVPLDAPGVAASAPQPVAPRNWVPILWLAGVAVQALAFGGAAFAMRRRLLRDAAEIHDPAVLALARSCASEMGVSVRLFATDAVHGPAVMGLWRPRLLLPCGLAEKLSREELRFVLLHECAHLRRRDLAALWLLTAARIVHWFNPLVWLAVRVARADVELACDETVLKNTTAPLDYGATLLKLAGMASGRPSLVPAMGIVQSKKSIRTRLARIGRYCPGRRFSIPTLLVLAMMGLAFGADEKTPPIPASEPVAEPAKEAPPAEAPKPETEKEAPAEPAKESPAEPVAAPAAKALAVPPPAAVEQKFKWARGWSVLGITIPGKAKIKDSEVDFQAPDGRHVKLSSGTLTREGVCLETLDWSGSPMQARVVLRKGKETAEFFSDASAVANDEAAQPAHLQIELASKFIEVPQEFADALILPKSVQLSRGKNGVPPAKIAILNQAQVDRFLTQMPKTSNVMSAPRVTTKSQQRAVIEVIRECRYPTQWKREPKSPAPAMWNPSAFETRNVGVTLETESTWTEDKRIELNATPMVTELEGWLDLDKRKALPGPRPDPAKALSERSQSGPFPWPASNGNRIKPVFSERKANSTVSLRSGDSVIFVGVPETAELAPVKPAYAGKVLVVIITTRTIDPAVGSPR